RSCSDRGRPHWKSNARDPLHPAFQGVRQALLGRSCSKAIPNTARPHLLLLQASLRSLRTGLWRLRWLLPPTCPACEIALLLMFVRVLISGPRLDIVDMIRPTVSKGNFMTDVLIVSGLRVFGPLLTRLLLPIVSELIVACPSTRIPVRERRAVFA